MRRGEIVFDYGDVETDGYSAGEGEMSLRTTNQTRCVLVQYGLRLVLAESITMQVGDTADLTVPESWAYAKKRVQGVVVAVLDPSASEVGR